MSPLSVAAFMDGRLGHEKQTKGVLAAMAELTALDITFHPVIPGFFFNGLTAWGRYLASGVWGPKRYPASPPIDLIIGTGTYTHIPMLDLKRRCGGRAVTCMSPCLPILRLMDLCLIPEHDGRQPGGNIFITIGPPNTSSAKGMHRPDRGLILVGGIDPKSHRWSTSLVLSQIRTLLETDAAAAWTVSSSPRTPEATCAALEELEEINAKVHFYRSDATSSGWIETQYDISDRVWVTADSISMVFEALTAGCRVGILPVEWKRGRNKIKRSVDYLCGHGWVTPFERWISRREMVSPQGELDEATRCAKEILNRWWPDRLPSYNFSLS